MKGEAALSGDAKWYLGHHRNASVPLAGPGVVGGGQQGHLQNAEPFLTSPPGCALDPCEALSFPAISRISQTGNGLTPASSVFTQGLGFLYPSSFFPSKPKIFAPYLCKEVHALGVGRTTSNPSDCVGIRFLPRVAQSREVLQVLWQWGEIAQKY